MPTRFVLYQWFKKYEKKSECRAAGCSGDDIAAKLHSGEGGGEFSSKGEECRAKGYSDGGTDGEGLICGSALQLMGAAADESAVQDLVGECELCPKTAVARSVCAGAGVVLAGGSDVDSPAE